MPKKTPLKNETAKAWDKSVKRAMAVLEKTAKKRAFDCSHTADGKILKIGLKVYSIDDPTIQLVISNIEDEITRRGKRVTLTSKEQQSSKQYCSKLFVNQAKAVDACIIDIEQARRAILRDAQESLDRLDADNMLKKLKRQRKKLEKTKG